jgi:hypothetical protein
MHAHLAEKLHYGFKIHAKKASSWHCFLKVLANFAYRRHFVLKCLQFFFCLQVALHIENVFKIFSQQILCVVLSIAKSSTVLKC